MPNDPSRSITGEPPSGSSPQRGAAEESTARAVATRSAGVPAGPAARSRQKLIYILGTGRCGSTILEIVLGSHPKIQPTGEFHGIPFPRWMPGTVCSCGRSYEECPLWSRVREEYGRRVDLSRQLATQERFEYYRSLPRALLYRWAASPEVREHARGMADLVRVIAKESGKEIVSDSSKSAARGYAYTLARYEGLDVYFIHLVRDGRGYLYSETKEPDGAGYGKRKVVQSPSRITLRWALENLVAQILCSRPRDRYLRVRYEDFVSQPVEVLERIGRFVGVDMTPVIETVRAGEPIPIGHLIGGNRLRFGSTVKLESRFRELALGTRRTRWTFWILGGWMALWYGYPAHAQPSNRPLASA